MVKVPRLPDPYFPPVIRTLSAKERRKQASMNEDFGLLSVRG